MFEQLLEAIALSLERRHIPYMVVGGQAVLLYGEPRLTRDIDVTLGIGPDRHSEIIQLAAENGWRILVESPAEFVEKNLVLPCADPQSGVRVDFIFSFSEYERQALERARRVAMGETEVRFAAVEDLIIHKLVAGRPRDVEDVRNILLKRPALEMPYLRRWLEDFDRSLGGSRLQNLERLLKSSDINP
ncbi:MAG: nucleotidyltransferase [Acidobacteria bacterium]|nr:nucleotidyltransferase [Acidobacteriota bacterium]